MTVQPMIGQWYHYPEKAQKFFVTALDIESDNVEIQYFDGAIDEMDVTTWYDSYIQIVEAPEDGSFPSNKSRKVPPPIPVTAAIKIKPTISNRLREAASAPVAANTATPATSRNCK